MPLPCPRPTRARLVFEPGAGLSSDSFNFYIPSEDLVDRLAAHLRDLFDGAQRLQSGDRGLDDVDGIVGAERLGEDVVDAGELEHCAHRTARDHTRPFACWPHDDVPRAHVDL